MYPPLHSVRRALPVSLRNALLAGAAAAVLAGCQVSEFSTAKHLAPVPDALERKIASKDMKVGSPILVRIFKEEATLEVWKKARNGRYQKLKDYEICAWSGELGPKFKEGDRQAPEGFYTVGPGQMNPNSSYHLSFNIGFPNAYDRSHKRTGSHLMVHGDCSSRGCYAMEDEQIQEIYALAREAFNGGQRGFQVQAFPFRMTPENMAKHRDSEHFEFWEMLKEGSDHFEATQRPPQVNVCGKEYIYNASSDERFVPAAACPEYQVDPGVQQLVAAKRSADMAEREQLIARLDAREERQKRREARESAVASFFGNDNDAQTESSANTGEVTAEDEAAPATAVAGIPVPRMNPRAPGAETATASTSTFRIPNPFRSGKSRSVETAAVPAPAVAPPPVASTAGIVAEPAPVVSQPATEPAPTVVAQEPVETAPLGYQDEDEGGFFSSVTKGSRGLFRKAGNLFN